jgi:hypothetical protein
MEGLQDEEELTVDEVVILITKIFFFWSFVCNSAIASWDSARGSGLSLLLGTGQPIPECFHDIFDFHLWT